jgi:hypothetical protein
MRLKFYLPVYFLKKHSQTQRYFVLSTLLLFLYEDGGCIICPIPSFGCEGVWFFGLGCFPGAVGMGKVILLPANQNGTMLLWMG